MTVKEAIDALERFAPLSLQEDYDNAGLQVGLTEADVSGVLLCLDVTPDIIAEALREGCNLIVSHHPLIFRGLKQLCDQNMVARCVGSALRHNLTLYAAHTNLDNAEGGVNYELASRLGATVTGWLKPLSDGKGGSGAVAELPATELPADFLRRVKQTLGVHTLCTNQGPADRPIRRIGLCGGSGDFLLDEAVRQGCDCFLTGEMHYHQYFGHEADIWIGVLGHYQSEIPTVQLLRRILADACPDVRLVVSAIDTNPIRYI